MLISTSPTENGSVMTTPSRRPAVALVLAMHSVATVVRFRFRCGILLGAVFDNLHLVYRLPLSFLEEEGLEILDGEIGQN
jgi:hypothetical protein